MPLCTSCRHPESAAQQCSDSQACSQLCGGQHLGACHHLAGRAAGLGELCEIVCYESGAEEGVAGAGLKAAAAAAGGSGVGSVCADEGVADTPRDQMLQGGRQGPCIAPDACTP